MNGAILDSELADGLSLMAEARWVEAQQILADRLRNNKEADQKRLNYFLLSITSASSGKEDLGNKLWAKAQEYPCGERTARYLDLQFAPNDPRQSMLLDLERAWWNFNQWNSGSANTKTTEQAMVFDWDLIINSAKAGESAELESKYGRCFDNPNCETAIVWNFLALAYLESGNVRTYEEMVGNRPAPPKSVPVELAEVLKARDLESVQVVLEKGEWLKSNHLTPPAQSFDNDSQTVGLSDQEWQAAMENGFALLDLNQFLEAGRAFQTTSSTEDRTRQLLGLNALALSFFMLGDYTQSETVYGEFKMLLEQFPIDPESELVTLYKRWLESVNALPEDGTAFFKPFGTKSDWSGELATEDPVDLWKTLGECLGLCTQNQHGPAKKELQSLETQLGDQATTEEKYLITLCFLISAVLAGDHFEVQEFEVELNSLGASAQFSEEQLQETKDILRWAGLEQLSQLFEKAEQGRPPSLNPWQDVAVKASEESNFDTETSDDFW